MSTTVHFFEEFHLEKENKKGADLVRKLADYILQYTEMKGLENLDILFLELCCGESRVSIENILEIEPGNTWIITQNGLTQHKEQHIIWNQEHPLIRLVESLKPGQDITFRVTGSMTRLYGTNYTYQYWLPVFEGVRPEDLADYKCAEAADTDEFVQAYHLYGNGTDEVPRNQSLDSVSDISCWYGENFSIKVSTDNEDIYDEFEERIGEALQNLVDDLENEYLEPDVYEGEAELTGSLELRKDQIPGFLTSLQAVADAAKELDAVFECAGELLPTETTNHGIEPFAVLKITGTDGEISTKACRFDQ